VAVSGILRFLVDTPQKQIPIIHFLMLSDLLLILVLAVGGYAPTGTGPPQDAITFSVNAIKIQIPGDYRQKDEFRKHVLHTFNDMEKLSPYLRQILEAAKKRPCRNRHNSNNK
jgi:hypothetical protein